MRSNNGNSAIVQESKIIITAEDIRQYVYCPRKAFFRHVRSLFPKVPFKAERGVEIHEARERYQPQNEDGVNIKHRYYDVTLESEALGLHAVLDYFETVGEEPFPVELKTGALEVSAPPDFHIIQLAVQAMLLEEHLSRPINKGRIIYVDCHNQRVDIPITIEMKQAALAAANHIRRMVVTEEMPDPTPHAGKCEPCEMWNYCFRS